MERLSEDKLGSSNVHESPMVQIPDICHEFQLIEGVRNMFNGILMGKQKWENPVWDCA